MIYRYLESWRKQKAAADSKSPQSSGKHQCECLSKQSEAGGGQRSGLIFKNQIFSSLSPGVSIMTRCWGAEAEALWTVGLVSLAESFILQRAELRQPVRPDQNEMHRPCGESVRGYTAVLWGREGHLVFNSLDSKSRLDASKSRNWISVVVFKG